MVSRPDTHREWTFGRRRYVTGGVPLLMGILNVTPDSFSDGGEYSTVSRAVDQGMQLAADGADILDIGGESTRPGSSAVSAEDERARVLPVIEALRPKLSIPISIDTTKAAVAREAIAAGAEIINDISGLTFDPEMPAVCHDSDCGVICMHIRGTPQTMQDDPQYDDVLRDVSQFLTARMDSLSEQGILPERIVLDPGIGFGKTAPHNLELLANIDRLRGLGRPILIGHSRKRFLKRLLRRDVEERLAGTIGVAIALAEQRCDLIRVHDVRSVRDALTAWQMVRNHRDEAAEW